MDAVFLKRKSGFIFPQAPEYLSEPRLGTRDVPSHWPPLVPALCGTAALCHGAVESHCFLPRRLATLLPQMITRGQLKKARKGPGGGCPPVPCALCREEGRRAKLGGGPPPETPGGLSRTHAQRPRHYIPVVSSAGRGVGASCPFPLEKNPRHQ